MTPAAGDTAAIHASLEEPNAFAAVFDRHFDAVHRYASRRVGPDLADEIAAETFTLVGDALRETAATPAQRAALFEVAARIPGVELVGEVTDEAGRAGIAVAMNDYAARTRFTLVFDPASYELLAEEQATLPGNAFGYPAGTVIGHATYLAREVTTKLPA